MKNKSDIPNQVGFRLVLIHADNRRFPCTVQLLEDGSHTAFDIHTGFPITREHAWGAFIGWEELPQKTPLELHSASLPAFEGMRKTWQCSFTKDQLLHMQKPVPKKGEVSIVMNLNRLERVTLTPVKGTYGKPLYLVEQWSKV